MDARNDCFRPYPDDPVFSKYFQYLFVYFPYHFPLRTNWLKSSTKAVKSCFDFYFFSNIPNVYLYLKLKSHVRRLILYQQYKIPTEIRVIQVVRFTW